MNHGAKILGHHIHPILIVFPLGLLATATIFDVIFLTGGSGSIASAAYWMIAAGIVGGLVAAAFGWYDWFAIPAGTRAKRIGLTHGVVNTFAILLYAASWYFRMDAMTHPPISASVLSICGAGVALVGGWLGGELVERLGIGVDPGANPNAPSSLTVDDIGAMAARRH